MGTSLPPHFFFLSCVCHMGICRRSRYLGVVKNGVADLGVQAKWRSQVRYVWTVKIFNYEEEFETSLRCGDADARGVPFPEGWRTALKCLGHGLGQKAGQAAEGLRAGTGHEHVECLLLGLPKPVALPPDGATRVVGCVAQLKTRGGMPESYLLAAYIEDNQWFCLKGVLDSNGELEAFDPKDLVVKDIVRDAFQPETAPRRRIMPHASGPQLVEGTRAHQQSWWRVVAIATWRAENLRAERRPFDSTAAGAGFESNPFRWTVAEGRLSHADVTFSWAWWEDGAWRRELVSVRANDISSQDRGVPIPDGIKSDDERILSSLLAATENKGKVPCEYLGLDLGNDHFEPDPAKWPSGSCPRGRKTQAIVTFEWKHVARGDSKEPHRVRVTANHAMLRGVPQNPLEQSGPKSLWFAVEFMQAYAEQRWPGTVYTGISYETADGRKPWFGFQKTESVASLFRQQERPPRLHRCCARGRLRDPGFARALDATLRENRLHESPRVQGLYKRPTHAWVHGRGSSFCNKKKITCV